MEPRRLKEEFDSRTAAEVADDRRSHNRHNQWRRWLFEGIRQDDKATVKHQSHWWNVMCLTGVDYFSTLGYQPGIAFVAAGVLSPLATLIVVLVTLFGLVPLYGRVAKESPFGQGSISMLERLVPGWKGKAMILILLGFAATDFIITITLSAADATAHIITNPWAPFWLQNKIGVTICMLLILGAVFLKGFREAIGLSVLLVILYLACNTVVIATGCNELVKNPQLLSDWTFNLQASYKSIFAMIGTSVILFPKLALGMSGFETGVAVMPLIEGDKDDQPDKPIGRINNTRKLLFVAAVIMAIFLMFSAVITTVLIPPAAFQHGGQADGRALAYLAHKFCGEGFGTAYDVSTILILWFAGASAMAGLLNLVPRYLPRFGMAPDWTRAQRPLVLVFTVITLIVTIVFRADVDAQAGAYATGVLVLFTSAALAVAMRVWNESMAKRVAFTLILLVFIYTTIANVIERPEGLQIASLFIIAIVLSSLISRMLRSLELRTQDVHLDELSQQFINDSLQTVGGICLLAHRPDGSTKYAEKELETRKIHKLTLDEASFVFLEMTLTDPSEFAEECLQIRGEEIDGFRILRCRSSAIPNAVATLLLHIRDTTKCIPHAYFGWTEGHPLGYVFKYIFFGEGETAPVTREILRKIEPDPKRRPVVIVG
jgi:hypothetical protein